jgi:transcription elongation factor Elf1
MCADPKCTTRTTSKWLLGKAAQCFYCSQEFIITSKKLNRQGFLHCDECKRGGTGKKIAAETPTISEIEKLLRKEL